MKFKKIPSTRVQPGDLATHKGGHLDPRRVVNVNQTQRTVTIDILGTESQPLPISNYNFEREA